MCIRDSPCSKGEQGLFLLEDRLLRLLLQDRGAVGAAGGLNGDLLPAVGTSLFPGRFGRLLPLPQRGDLVDGLEDAKEHQGDQEEVEDRREKGRGKAGNVDVYKRQG